MYSRRSCHIYFIATCICLVVLISACVNKNKAHTGEDGNSAIADCEFVKVDVDMSHEYYDSVMNRLCVSKLIVLKESDDAMFSEIDKIIADDDSYYILDSFGARTLVSFDSNGEAITKYGRVGQGPGEYFRPMDFDVYDSHVYILDANARKILKYRKDGSFICEKQIPFTAMGLKILRDGHMMFCMEPSDGGRARLCLTDSTISSFKYFLNSEKGYVGGFLTNDMFRNKSDGMMYYESPLDTLYYFDDSGRLTGGLVFDFGEKQVPNEAKLDYLNARENGLLRNTLRLTNNPISLNDGIMVGTVNDDESQYILFFNPLKGVCGARNCDQNKSIYDIIEPATVDAKGNLICYIWKDYIEQAKDYETLSDSIKSSLTDNNYILLLYTLK